SPIRICFFSSLLPRPPPSPLSPYTPLFRSDPPGVGPHQPEQHAQERRLAGAVRAQDAVPLALRALEGDPVDGGDPAVALGHLHRSEEHTSELQSLTNLVCRLLLEKKNTQTP